MKRLKESQSQKSMVNLGFHKDLANHFVKPNYVNIICLRNSSDNCVVTYFVRNIDLLNYLDSETLELLEEDNFFTPYDALTKDGDKEGELGKAGSHSILYDNKNIAFFEGRTTGLTDQHQRAVDKVKHALHVLKRGIHFEPGDFISTENDRCLHGKQIIEVNQPERLKERWLMKTVNVINIQKIKKHLLKDKRYIVNG